MKKTILYVLSAAAVLAGCDSRIPSIGTVNNALVEEVVLDGLLAGGLTMETGTTLYLPDLISVMPEDATNTAQTYESSDPGVAEVTPQGMLNALKEGNCTITVYVGTDGVYSEFDLQVVKPADVAITSLRFTKDEEEYESVLGTVDITRLLYVGSASPTEEATEPILFESSDEEVATIDAAGVITIKKLGATTITATASVSTDNGSPITSSIDLKFFKWLEYERFPGDGDGNGDGVNDGSPRAIMGSSASEWDKLPHDDGGWSVYEFGQIETSGKSWNAGTGARNCYRYAMFDNRRIVSRSGAANNLPTATNGTAFCWSRPVSGGNKNEKEVDGSYFIIDMQKQLLVNYFRIVNISNHKDDRGIFVTGVSQILGSNDPKGEWTELASDVRGFNPRSTEYHDDASTVYLLESEKAIFSNETPYRYIKFVFNKQDKCYGFYNADGTTDRDGGTIQIAELYMGCKVYSE